MPDDKMSRIINFPPASTPQQHSDQPCLSLLMATYSEIVIKRTIFQQLHDNHGWVNFSDNTIQPDNVGVGELTHDGCLREKVIPLLS